MFRTPRLLLEIRRDGIWKAKKIYCDYSTAKKFLDALPKLAKSYKIELDDMRVKNLRTIEQIAEAKLQVDNNL